MNVDLNDPNTWRQVIPAPPFDVLGYQQQIDRICGLNLLGRPNILLTWMPDVENWSYKFTEWIAGGFGTTKVLKSQYVFDTINGVDIPPPRWAFKQWQSGAQYAANDNQIRWKRREFGGITEYRETRPALPLEGCYIPHPSPLLRVGRHNDYCCELKKADGQKCYGEYREPDESYLLLLQAAVARRDAENAQDPNAALTDETLISAAIEAAAIVKEQEEQNQKNLSEWVDENWQQAYVDYVGDPSLFDTKKFSIPKNLKKSKGGILTIG
jgi:hypothetical protein